MGGGAGPGEGITERDALGSTTHHEDIEMIKKVAFIAQPTKDIAASRRFYGEVLGLENAANYADHWSEYQAADKVAVALDTFSPQYGDDVSTYLALETDDIEAEMARLREAGVTIAKDVWTNQDEQDRTVCKMAMIVDPDGNPVMLHELSEWRREG